MDESAAEHILTAWKPDQYYTYRPVPVYVPGEVPEPSTGLLVVLGLGLLGLRRKIL